MEFVTRRTPLFFWQRSGANLTSFMCFIDKLNLSFLSLSSRQPSCLPVRLTGHLTPRGSCLGEWSWLRLRYAVSDTIAGEISEVGKKSGEIARTSPQSPPTLFYFGDATAVTDVGGR